LNRRVAAALTGALFTLVALLGLALFGQTGRLGLRLQPNSPLLSKNGPLAGRVSFVSNTSLAEADADDDAPAPPVPSNYDLSAHQTLSRVILLIRENYVEPDRIKPYDMFLAALDYIQKTVPEVMVDDTEAPTRITVSAGTVSQAFDLGGLDQLWEVTMALRDIFRFLQTRISDPTQRRDIEYAAINGMLSTLDPHSVLLKPESFDEVKLQTKGEFGGLGIVISLRDGALTIISPIEGTPASQAGLKAKDKIVKIGEESTMNMGLDEAVQRLRGKPGSKVTMWIQRKNFTEPKKFILPRAIIKIESVASEMLPDGVGYVKLKSFQGNSFDDLQAHLEKLRKKNHDKELKGLVLDMRNNPGGLLDQAILISDRFIDKGPLVITVGEGNRKREVKSAHATASDRTFPIVVLLNGGSASASEIVSGALKNHDRAVVIGQQSFGKGSVQVLYDFKDRSALKLTIAQYLTPGDLSIQSVGITPDVQIVPAVVETGNIHLFVDDDSPREKDLEKHLDQHGAVSQVGPSQQIKITYLLPKEKKDIAKAAPGAVATAAPAAAAAADEDEPLPGAFEFDFETHLAHDVLVQAKSFDRRAILKEAMPLFAARAQEQEDIITRRLGELGVDWKPAPTRAEEGAPKAEVQIKTNAFAAPAVSGSVLKLTGSVHNSGTAPLYRVYGVTSSDNPLLKGLEFMFGKVLPGETRTWDIQIKLPADMSSRADSVTLSLGDHRGVTRDVTGVAFVHIAEQKHPRFAFNYRVDDAAHGNGDGALQLGEQVNLVVRVQNLGPGVADDVTVTLKNLSGKSLFLDQGRVKVGKLAVGEEKTATLSFSVKGQAATADMRLLMWDSLLGAPLSETLKLPVLEARRAKTDDFGLKAGHGGESVAIYAGATEQMPLLGHVKAGTVLHGDARFAGWYRVATPGSVPGFVRSADAEVSRARKASPAGFKAAPGVTTPNITVALPSLVVPGEVLRLQATLNDERRLKDVFVFINEKKVYYRSLEDAKHTDRGVQASIDVPLKLKEGANQVAVVVREDDDMIARKIFGVFRTSAKQALPPPAAAHRPAGQTASKPLPAPAP
jgi:carboxyl-terminal processing protease